MIKPPPKSKIGRGKVVGKALLKIGTKQAKGFVKRSLGSKKRHEAIKEQTHEEIANVIFEALGELKGLSVKVAQQIALGMPFLSPVYLEKISQSFNAIPPLNKSLVRKIIKQELGVYPQEVFDHFNNDAFAAASLGQVHKAKYQCEDIAIKIQYPGIKQSIQNDMSLIHFGLKRFAKGKNVDHLITEIEDRLYEEVEYELEAKNITFFAEHIDLEGIIIPKVYTHLSTGRILTTQLLEGMNFESFLATNPSQEVKDAYAQLIFDSFFYTLYKLRCIHADPNPGNFLFMENNKLGLIDFGCIKKVDEAFLERYTALHLSILNATPDEEIIEHYVGFGMIVEDTKEAMLHFYREVIKPLDRLYIEPLLGENYDFKVNNDFSKKGFERIFEVHQKQFNSVHQVNKEYIFLDRTLLGYYAIFEKMGAKIETGNVKNIMNQFQGEKNDQNKNTQK
jgi:predicted unusual protein kinase regulating ubiquinone biosynthesis (AarF/ABC1/UbiB family)